MYLVAQYKQFAADYRRLAARLTKPADKQASELFAIGWDRAAENREAMLLSKVWAEPIDVRCEPVIFSAWLWD
jgi:hypothetical protein